jgi:hypothetical protein
VDAPRGEEGLLPQNHASMHLCRTKSALLFGIVKSMAAVLYSCHVQALALGASAVLLGRPVLYGLAVGGAAGVQKVLEMLQQELELAMALTGCPSLRDIAAAGPRLLLKRPGSGLVPVAPWAATSIKSTYSRL